MIELYGAGPSRWVKCYWMLKELNQPFTEHVVDFKNGEHKTATMLEMNPFGKVPILIDGKITLYESMAIVNYLGEKYPEFELVPKAGTFDRAYYDQWTSFCITGLEQTLWRVTKHTFLLPENQRIQQDVQLAKDEFAQLAHILDEQIGNRSHLVGNRFTAADITMGYTLSWARSLDMLVLFKNCTRYLEEVTARPAFPVHLYNR